MSRHDWLYCIKNANRYVRKSQWIKRGSQKARNGVPFKIMPSIEINLGREVFSMIASIDDQKVKSEKVSGTRAKSQGVALMTKKSLSFLVVADCEHGNAIDDRDRRWASPYPKKRSLESTRDSKSPTLQGPSLR